MVVSLKLINKLKSGQLFTATTSKQLKYIREAARASAASSIARHNVEARNAKKKKSNATKK
jgi:hypothetical protein